MTDLEMAEAIVNGLIETGVEGPFDAVSCSTAGDYPSIGCSQWEGSRADILLSYIDGGDYFAERSYSDLEESGDIESLSELLGSEQGEEAQRLILRDDAMYYVEELKNVLDNPACIIYAGLWCPTSNYVVKRFIRNRSEDYDVNDLEVLFGLFRDEYAIAADCEEYADGYANRAIATYNYVINL